MRRTARRVATVTFVVVALLTVVAPTAYAQAGRAVGPPRTAAEPGPVLTLAVAVDGGPMTPDHWLVSASSPGGTSFLGVPGTPGATSVVVPGAYTLGVVAGNVVSSRGYEVLGWDCGSAHPVVDDTVTLAAGDAVTCTLGTRWIGGTLTVRAIVEGGPAAPEAFTLRVVGPGVDALGSTGDPALTSIPVVPGSYEMGGTVGGPSPYVIDRWTCVGATVQDNIATVGAHADAVCTTVFAYWTSPGEPQAAATVTEAVPSVAVDPGVPAGATLAATGRATGPLVAAAVLLVVGGAALRLGSRVRVSR